MQYCQVGSVRSRAVVELRGGGEGPLKDRVAPSKQLVWEGTGGPLKGPLEITRQIQYMIATYQSISL